MNKLDVILHFMGRKMTLNILLIVAIVLLYSIIILNLIKDCSNVPRIIDAFTQNQNEQKSQVTPMMSVVKKSKKEGFVGANTNYGESSAYSLAHNNPVDTKKWSAPNLTIQSGKPLSDGVKSIMDREAQPIPLPKDEMLLFADTPFKPECCPNTYSNSSGCACMTTGQYDWLIGRGGNNVPYSEY